MNSNIRTEIESNILKLFKEQGIVPTYKDLERAKYDQKFRTSLKKYAHSSLLDYTAFCESVAYESVQASMNIMKTEGEVVVGYVDVQVEEHESTYKAEVEIYYMPAIPEAV